MASTKNKSMTFEEAFQKLESIVETLEKGESTLDASMKLFEEGMELSRFCAARLNEAEKQLLKLVKREDGDFQMELME
jgi:exodeoxyribonuclease VII small subunit